MTHIVRKQASNRIRTFYKNVAKKYKHTYSLDLMIKNIDDALNAMLRIENGLPRRNPILSRWKGLFMTVYKVDNKPRWYYAYKIDKRGNVIIVDARHSLNMHESKNVIRLTENQFIKLISESVGSVLKECVCESVRKDSYQAKPKKDGRLNDWEIENIFSRIVTELVTSKRITPEDGDMLLYYGLYNNDCFSHVNS